MPNRKRILLAALLVGVFFLIGTIVLAVVYYSVGGYFDPPRRPLTAVSTLAGEGSGIGEPFGIAERSGEIYVSDGITRKIWRIKKGKAPIEFSAGFNTPSAIAFTSSGDLIVADTGSHTIKKVSRGSVDIIAGVENEFGDADGPALSAKFNAPVGLTVLRDDSIVVADTYNDKIKLIKDGSVTTLAGSRRGFADGAAGQAKFDTPCGVAVFDDGTIIVADTMNARIRVISSDGLVSTAAGRGDGDSRDGTLLDAGFYRPFSMAISSAGDLYIGDGNALRVIPNGPLPLVRTISKRQRGFADGPVFAARYNRISGIAVTGDGEVLVADSDNAAVRRISRENDSKSGLAEYVPRTKRTDPTEFRARASGRWPYDPPEAKRDVAGTLGEIRGRLVDQDSEVWFHNGLDIAGGYGERARFIRDETVLSPVSVENYDTLRELIRLPTIGYIHIRLGRDSSNKAFGDSRFQFDPDMKGVRVRRGSSFRSGDVIGTLNPMNHVHLIAGPPGDEMNALDALWLPGVSDTITPVIEETKLFDQNWIPVETKGPDKRIILAGKTRVVVRAFDRMDGNPDRRRLGVFRLGYQVLDRDHSVHTETAWNISFDRNPASDAVKYAYATGSHSGATGETIFNYIVTNKVDGDSFSEGFLDPASLNSGSYVLRVFAADFFGNIATKDINFEVEK